MAFGTFKVLDSEDLCIRKNRKVSPSAILDPSNAAPLQQGEFLVPSGTKKTVMRIGVGTTEGSLIAFPCAAPAGSTDVQGSGRSEFYIKWREAVTTSYDSTKSYTVGTELKLDLVTISGQTYSILTPVDTADDKIVAVVEEPPVDATAYDEMTIISAMYVNHA